MFKLSSLEEKNRNQTLSRSRTKLKIKYDSIQIFHAAKCIMNVQLDKNKIFKQNRSFFLFKHADEI